MIRKPFTGDFTGDNMLAAWVDSVLADFIRRRIPFSHRDIADHIPGLLPHHVDDVRRLVFERMVSRPAYRLSIAHFVGEGLTLMCIPREPAFASPARRGMSLVESDPVVS